ncbi:MAG: ureidoglycolate lyase [Gammaproteobacteria bacterium]|nr:ureidoglycolate lyase [Gammaproteobacteria bacterium]NNF50041.1 ureidoglycolate lyase [Woeseiaceae bacterium]MBT8094320.1 ureidoglycolate lyase [Gammaproteobacteria bacterium]MBT8106425.1 ureidoglycolate lyase [Gammaproteobacteria bacterium]NNK26440.1 ureidoglycolate lyase [Woeseiaceae bacterium]
MADTIALRPVPLTRARFAPYGDVIDASHDAVQPMNEARFERFDDLCDVDLGDGGVAISVTRARTATVLPLRVDCVERHPLGSQAFVPLSPCTMVVVVAPPGEAVEAGDLRAFVTNGRQGINYHRGTWHMPLIAFEAGQEYLIVDRAGCEHNCDEHELDTVVMLEAP